MPRRAIAPGLHMGLSITLNTQVEESYCTEFQSTGMKALLHVPVSQPEMVEYGTAISPGELNTSLAFLAQVCLLQGLRISRLWTLR